MCVEPIDGQKSSNRRNESDDLPNVVGAESKEGEEGESRKAESVSCTISSSFYDKLIERMKVEGLLCDTVRHDNLLE